MDGDPTAPVPGDAAPSAGPALPGDAAPSAATALPPGVIVPEFTAGALIKTAARILSTERTRVLVPAVVVFGLSAVADTFLVEFDRSLNHWEGVVVIVLQAFSSLGLTFYAGLLDRLVGAVGEGRPAPSIRSVLVGLPYGRLIAADVLLWIIDLVSTATFVIPGMVLFTLFAIVGPLINMEDHGLYTAFRHSARLVWPHFWLVLLMVTLPLAIEHELLATLEDLLHSTSAGVLFATEFVVGLVFGATVGLIEVVIAEALMRRHRLRVLASHEGGKVARHDAMGGRPGAVR